MTNLKLIYWILKKKSKLKTGYTVDVLAVHYYIKTLDNKLELSTPVWSKRNDHGDLWHFGQVSYPGGNESITNFVILAEANEFSSGNIAIGKLRKFSNEFMRAHIWVICFSDRRHWLPIRRMRSFLHIGELWLWRRAHLWLRIGLVIKLQLEKS